MSTFWWIVWGILGSASAVTLGILMVRLNQANKRISRSIDPIDQKIKGLRLEVSALRQSRADRQRRLRRDK